MFPRNSVSFLLDLCNCQAYTVLHSEYTPVSLEFVPLMQAYFVPEDYYCEGEVLTMPIPSPLALEVDIRSFVDGEAKYTVSIDTSTNRAVIQKS